MGSEQRLVHYAAAEPTTFRTEEVGAEFGDTATLRRVKLDGEPLQGGEVLRLRLRWKAAPDADLNHNVFLHLVSEQGQIHAQQDVPLQAAGRVGLLLPRALAPGNYHLRIGAYDPETGERLLLLTGENSISIEGVEVR